MKSIIMLFRLFGDNKKWMHGNFFFKLLYKVGLCKRLKVGRGKRTKDYWYKYRWNP